MAAASAPKSPTPDHIHATHMSHALRLAKLSPPKPTNYCVGALLVSSTTNTVLSTGYTLELPGNTHAEQCCLLKLAAESGVSEERVGELELVRKEAGVVLYTTVEPCAERLSGQTPCVERITETRKAGAGIQRVYVGVKEPDTFVKANSGAQRLEAAGLEVVHVPGFEDEILKTATAGHVKEKG